MAYWNRVLVINLAASKNSCKALSATFPSYVLAVLTWFSTQTVYSRATVSRRRENSRGTVMTRKSPGLNCLNYQRQSALIRTWLCSSVLTSDKSRSLAFAKRKVPSRWLAWISCWTSNTPAYMRIVPNICSLVSLKAFGTKNNLMTTLPWTFFGDD